MRVEGQSIGFRCLSACFLPVFGLQLDGFGAYGFIPRSFESHHREEVRDHWPLACVYYVLAGLGLNRVRDPLEMGGFGV